MLLIVFRVVQDPEGVTRPIGRTHCFAIALPVPAFDTVLPTLHTVWRTPYLTVHSWEHFSPVVSKPWTNAPGVGETLRRVICKSICLITRDDAESVCGSVQLCAGVRCGVEGAIHAASDLFNNNDYSALTMDAHNEFNSRNRIS